jgi:uncharacterized protein
VATGFFALLDDIAALAKLAAASLDDAAAQAAKAGSKAAGIVIDDAAVTPRYVVGLASERELPIIKRIALGSLKNKLIFLLPGALLLSYFAPKLITPLLMFGGAFLCLEGFHKVAGLFHPHDSHDAQGSEEERIASAIRTDLILSAEIMAIALATVASAPPFMQFAILAVVGFGMTLGVYGLVALIVKADDFGVYLASSSQSFVCAIGKAIVKGMPYFLQTLSFVGMLAMLWVGGGIILHGLKELGVPAPEDTLHHIAHSVPQPALQWLIQAGLSAVLGVIIGAIADTLVNLFTKSRKEFPAPKPQ